MAAKVGANKTRGRLRAFRYTPAFFLLLGLALLLAGCAGRRFVVEESCRFTGRAIPLEEFAQQPFGHAEQVADFRRTMPRIHPMTALSHRPDGGVDTLSDIRLPKGGKILLYRLSDGRDALVVASVRNAHLRLRNGVHVGQSRQEVAERIAELPGGDTVIYRSDRGPRLTRLIFGEGERLLKVEIVGVVR